MKTSALATARGAFYIEASALVGVTRGTFKLIEDFCPSKLEEPFILKPLPWLEYPEGLLI